MRGVLAHYFWIASFIYAPQLAPEEQSPTWIREQEMVSDLSPATSHHDRAGIVFLNNEQLIVYAVEPTGNLSSRKSPEISSAFRLRVSLLDAKSGKQILARDWGTRPHDSAVQITSGGVLVRTGSIVKLYSADFAQDRVLPLAFDPNGTYFISVSASGKTILVSHYFKKQGNYISHIDVLDARTLKIRSSWDQQPPVFHFSMSDKRFVTEHDGVVALTEFEHRNESKVVAVSSTLKRGCAAGSTGPAIASNESIVLRNCKEVFLLNASGVSSSLEAFDGNGSAGAAGAQCESYIPSMFDRTAVTSDAPLVALSLPAIKVKKHLLTEPGVCLSGLQVAVYDSTLEKRVFTVNIAPLPKDDYDFALSPDGSKLAVLNDRKVSVYSVPVPTSNWGVAH